MAIRSNPFLRKMMEAGEAQIDRLVGQILSNERFVASVQTVVSRTLSAKGNLDRSIRAGLATMNLPSTRDIEDLRSRLDELDRSLADLGGKLSHVERTLSEAARAPKKASPAAGAGAAGKKKAAPAPRRSAAKKAT